MRAGFRRDAAAQKPEGQITEVSYMFPKPGTTAPAVPKVSFVTRVADLGCGSALDADTLPQRRLEVDRPAVLLEQIGEGLVSELLEIPPVVRFVLVVQMPDPGHKG
jgi:hypothetical protein